MSIVIEDSDKVCHYNIPLWSKTCVETVSEIWQALAFYFSTYVFVYPVNLRLLIDLLKMNDYCNS